MGNAHYSGIKAGSRQEDQHRMQSGAIDAIIKLRALDSRLLIISAGRSYRGSHQFFLLLQAFSCLWHLLRTRRRK